MTKLLRLSLGCGLALVFIVSQAAPGQGGPPPPHGDPFSLIKKIIIMEEVELEVPVPDYELVDVGGGFKNDPNGVACGGSANEGEPLDSVYGQEQDAGGGERRGPGYGVLRTGRQPPDHPLARHGARQRQRRHSRYGARHRDGRATPLPVQTLSAGQLLVPPAGPAAAHRVPRPGREARRQLVRGRDPDDHRRLASEQDVRPIARFDRRQRVEQDRVSETSNT